MGGEIDEGCSIWMLERFAGSGQFEVSATCHLKFSFHQTRKHLSADLGRPVYLLPPGMLVAWTPEVSFPAPRLIEHSR